MTLRCHETRPRCRLTHEATLEKEVQQIGCPVSTKAQELDTAKEILAEIFHIRPVDVEEMIQKQFEDRCRQVEREDGLWPATSV